MAVSKNQVCKNKPVILIEYTKMQCLADLICKDIDEKIKNKYVAGQQINIYIGEYFEDANLILEDADLVDEIRDRYAIAGWNTSDDDEGTITLF